MDVRNQQSDFQFTLPSDLEFRITRTFAAPRELVWRAITEPERIRRWWGCDQVELAVCEIDLRVGGAYRYLMRGRDGSEHRFKGEYREVLPPRRLVLTQIYDVEPHADRIAVATITLEDEAGRTRYTNTVAHASRADRDASMASGVEAGAIASLGRLADLLLTMS